MDVAASNNAITEGSLPKVMESTLERWKPEAAYFYADHGKRTAIFIVDLKDTYQIPLIAEPFFMSMNAEVNFTPVMNADDLRKGLGEWMKMQG